MPLASRLPPCSVSALTAPASIVTDSKGRLAAIHCLRAWRCSTGGMNRVPSTSPARMRCSTFSAAPEAITSGMPAGSTTSAAVILVYMPPEDMLLPLLPELSRMLCETARTSWISLASLWTRGSASYSPSMSERMISRSAPAAQATRADSVSLSPNLSSSTAIVSFSLITGITFMSARACIVLHRLR